MAWKTRNSTSATWAESPDRSWLQSMMSKQTDIRAGQLGSPAAAEIKAEAQVGTEWFNNQQTHEHTWAGREFIHPDPGEDEAESPLHGCRV